jgi:hypothetical protein
MHSPHQSPPLQQLQAFKAAIRDALLAGRSSLPIWAPQKAFDFTSLGYVVRRKQQLRLSPKSVGVLARLLEIGEVAAELMAGGQIITKRNLYYRLAKYYAGRYELIDSDLELLCFNAGLSRQQLGVFSSSRCLLFGELALSHNSTILRCSPFLITNVPLTQTLGIPETQCRRLVIVEKESAMYHLQQELSRLAAQDRPGTRELWQETIFLSAKGYPDSTSRQVVDCLLDVVSEVYYLGDCDVYGADILLCYCIGSEERRGFLPRVNWVQLQELADPHLLEGEALPQSREDHLKCIEVLQRPYFQELDLLVPWTSTQEEFALKLRSWRARIRQLQSSAWKFELETLFKAVP